MVAARATRRNCRPARRSWQSASASSRTRDCAGGSRVVAEEVFFDDRNRCRHGLRARRAGIRCVRARAPVHARALPPPERSTLAPARLGLSTCVCSIPGSEGLQRRGCLRGRLTHSGQSSRRPPGLQTSDGDARTARPPGQDAPAQVGVGVVRGRRRARSGARAERTELPRRAGTRRRDDGRGHGLRRRGRRQRLVERAASAHPVARSRLDGRHLHRRPADLQELRDESRHERRAGRPARCTLRDARARARLPMVQFIFQPSISKQLTQTSALEQKTARQAATVFYEPKIKQAAAEIASIQNSETTLENRVQKFTRLSGCENNEPSCSHTHRSGCGHWCRYYAAQANTARAALLRDRPLNRAKIAVAQGEDRRLADERGGRDVRPRPRHQKRPGHARPSAGADRDRAATSRGLALRPVRARALRLPGSGGARDEALAPLRRRCRVRRGCGRAARTRPTRGTSPA